MSDDLRTRIIAVLHDGGDMPASKAARLADKLIRDCNLFSREPLPERLRSYMEDQ